MLLQQELTFYSIMPINRIPTIWKKAILIVASSKNDAARIYKVNKMLLTTAIIPSHTPQAGEAINLKSFWPVVTIDGTEKLC